jgi:hypothetical protein
MKNLSRSLFLVVGLFAGTIAFGGVPPMTVTVSSAGGKASFKGTTDSKGAFATSSLPTGNYVVQFNANAAAVKGSHYSVVVSAGKKKVSASAVPGEKFVGGGVAMKVDVGAGLNITGQVVSDEKVSKSGKKMVWIPPVLGSHMPGHWAEEGSAEEVQSRNRGIIGKDRIQEMQSKGVGMPGS